MNTAAVTAQAQITQRQTLLVAWVATLLLSTLPNILFQELTTQLPAWVLGAKLGLMLGLIVGGFFIRILRPLQKYFAIFFVIYVAEELTFRLSELPQWQQWFAYTGASFGISMLGTQLRRLLVSLAVIAALFALRYSRKDFYLVKGDLDARAEPVRWLGIRNPSTWKRFGLIFALCISLGTLAFLVIAGRPSLNFVVQAAPLLPAVVVMAIMNSFNEEMSYRAGLLAPLYPVAGREQSLLLTAAFFGIGHFYGVPYGVIGVAMAGFLGWLLGKGMLETRGFFWPWFIHFLQDVLIFSFMAIGSVIPGGG